MRSGSGYTDAGAVRQGFVSPDHDSLSLGKATADLYYLVISQSKGHFPFGDPLAIHDKYDLLDSPLGQRGARDHDDRFPSFGDHGDFDEHTGA